MIRLVRDPLIHFLLLGGLLFLLYAWRGEEEGVDPFQIVISEEEVGNMRQALTLLHGREPEEDELLATIEPRIKEEILYREALALGLDQGDSLVRARLTEKMLFLTQDVAEPATPTTEELEAFFAADPERFFVPASVSFEQRFFSPSPQRPDLDSEVADAVTALRAGMGDDIADDELLFDASYERASYASLADGFGAGFAEILQTLAADAVWQGPVRSDFGLHAVRIIEQAAAYQPTFDQIAAEVSSVLVAERRLEANEAEYQQLRERYDIVIDIPDPAE
ncbi:MAG: peptidyl-prolyl cis-trans isomerase [Gammaproteobacteria bacterium]